LCFAFNVKLLTCGITYDILITAGLHC